MRSGKRVLLIDTDSLITLYYYKLGFENTEEFNTHFETIATEISYLNNYDLYIFLEPDVKWIQDGTRTYGDELVRIENNKKLKKIFDENNIKYVCISGDYQERYSKTKKMILELIRK